MSPKTAANDLDRRVREFGEDGGARRGWMWVSLSADAVCYHIDRFRSAEAARKLIASIPAGAGQPRHGFHSKVGGLAAFAGSR